MEVVTGEIVLMISVEPLSKIVENTVDLVQFEFDR
jgi:diacylglycerol kinase